MRVLQLISSRGFYGAERVVAELVNGFAGTPTELHLGVMTRVESVRQAFDREAAGAAAGRVYLEVQGALSLRVLRELGGYLAAHEIDIIHSHGYKSNFYAMLARMLCKREVLVLATVHSWILCTFRERLYKALDLAILSFLNRIAVVSRPLLEELSGHARLSSRCSLIANGVNVEIPSSRSDRATARERLGIAEHRLVVGCVASLTAEKAHADLVAAFQRVVCRRPDALLVLVGDGPCQEAIEAAAEAAGVKDHLLLLGRRQDARSLYCAFDIFALVSHTEGLPMALLEAMAAALPVVVSCVGEMPRVVSGNRNGRVVQPGDVEGIAAALLEIAACPETAASLGGNARATVVAEYSNLRMAKDYERLYRELLARPA